MIYPTNFCSIAEDLFLSGLGALKLFGSTLPLKGGTPRAGPEVRYTSQAGAKPGTGPGPELGPGLRRMASCLATPGCVKTGSWRVRAGPDPGK